MDSMLKRRNDKKFSSGMSMEVLVKKKSSHVKWFLYFVLKATRSELLCLCDAFMERLDGTDSLQKNEKDLLKTKCKSTSTQVNQLVNKKLSALNGMRMTEENLRSIGKWLIQFHEVISNDSLCSQCRSLQDCEVFLKVSLYFNLLLQDRKIIFQRFFELPSFINLKLKLFLRMIHSPQREFYCIPFLSKDTILLQCPTKVNVKFSMLKHPLFVVNESFSRTISTSSW